MSISYQLSDPWGDFLDSESQILLNKIIKKWGRNLTATDLFIIFNPILPAGTVRECLNYLPMAFNFFNNHISNPQNDVSAVGHSCFSHDGRDVWNNIITWVFRQRLELQDLERYNDILEKIGQSIENMMQLDWDISHNWNNFSSISQLISDAIASPILHEIYPQYQQLLLELFKSKSDKNCALILALFISSRRWNKELFSSAALVKSVYTRKILIESWDYLTDRYLEESTFYSKQSKDAIEAFLLEAEAYFTRDS